MPALHPVTEPYLSKSLPITYPLRLRAGGTPATTMAKGSFNERQRADCGGGRPARHVVDQNVIARFVGSKGPGKLRLKGFHSVSCLTAGPEEWTTVEKNIDIKEDNFRRALQGARPRRGEN